MDVWSDKEGYDSKLTYQRNNSPVLCLSKKGREKHLKSTGMARANTSLSYVREGSPILSLNWWGWGPCYESVVLGATAEPERRVTNSISCDITL